MHTMAPMPVVIQNRHAGPGMQNNNNASGTQNVGGFIGNVSGQVHFVQHNNPAAPNGESLISLS